MQRDTHLDMNKFPEYLNIKTCTDMMMKNEYELMELTRQQFTNIIDQHIRDINRNPITLVFDKRLSSDLKKELANELLHRFGRMKVTYALLNAIMGSRVSKYVSSEFSMPDNIISVELTL